MYFCSLDSWHAIKYCTLNKTEANTFKPELILGLNLKIKRLL